MLMQSSNNIFPLQSIVFKNEAPTMPQKNLSAHLRGQVSENDSISQKETQALVNIAILRQTLGQITAALCSIADGWRQCL